MEKKILIIEDNPLNLELVFDLLEIEGYDILQAETGYDGIELAKTEKPDLIVMDIQLPGMDGLSATRLLKADPETMDIPIVALTANAMKGDDQKVFDAGCTGYIPKPIDTRKLPEQIAGFLGI